MTNDYQKKYLKLKRLHNSINKAVKRLEEDNLNLKQQNDILVAEKKQWVIEKVMQEQIVQNSLNQSNDKNNNMLVQIEELKAELKRLKEGK